MYCLNQTNGLFKLHVPKKLNEVWIRVIKEIPVFQGSEPFRPEQLRAWALYETDIVAKGSMEDLGS